MNYDEAVTALYQAPVATFVAERKRLAGELRDAGDKASAAKLGKLGRPTLSAWVVNQLYWHARDAFDEMLVTADRLRAGDLGASAAHRESIAQLRVRAARILTDAGHGATDATLRRVTTTLSALAASGGFAPDPPGALAEDREPVGFDVAVALASVPVRTEPAGAASSPGPAAAKPVAVEPDAPEEELAPEDEAERRAELQRELDDKAAPRKAGTEAAVARPREAANDGVGARRREAARDDMRRREPANDDVGSDDVEARPRSDAAAATHAADEKRRAEAEAKRRADEAEAKRRTDEARAKKAAERSRLIAGLATARAELANRERAVSALSEQLEAAELKVAEIKELIAMFEAKLAGLTE